LLRTDGLDLDRKRIGSRENNDMEKSSDKAPKRLMAFGFVGLGLPLGTQTVAAQAVSKIQNAKPGDWPSCRRTYDLLREVLVPSSSRQGYGPSG
jgi:hypothetical protein